MRISETVLIYSLLKKLTTSNDSWHDLTEETIIDRLALQLKINESRNSVIASLIIFTEDAASMSTAGVAGAGDSGEAFVDTSARFKHLKRVKRQSKESGTPRKVLEEVPRGDLETGNLGDDNSFINPKRPRGAPVKSPVAKASDSIRRGHGNKEPNMTGSDRHREIISRSKVTNKGRRPNSTYG